MSSDAPAEVRQLLKISKWSLWVFLFFQIFGIFLLIRDMQGYVKIITDDLQNGTSLTLPELHRSGFSEFISGTSLSAVSGFWLSITWSGLRLKRAYSHRAYRILTNSFFAQVFFFVISFYAVFSQHKGIFNPGTVGSALTFFFTVPVFLQSREKNVQIWSQEYIPPAPIFPSSQ